MAEAQFIPVASRFFVGFISAQLFPAVKLAQNGLVLSQIDGIILLGAMIPPALLGVAIGAYAVIVEHKETDVGRLFRVCVSLPALILNLGAGEKGVTEANAKAVSYPAPLIIAPETPLPRPEPPPISVPEGQEVTCTPKDPLEVGAQAFVDALANNERPNWWILSTEGDRTRDWIVIDGQKYYIVSKSREKPASGLLFDCVRCKFEKADIQK